MARIRDAIERPSDFGIFVSFQWLSAIAGKQVYKCGTRIVQNFTQKALKTIVLLENFSHVPDSLNA